MTVSLPDMKRGIGKTFDIISFAIVATFLSLTALVLASRNIHLSKLIPKDKTKLLPGKPISSKTVIDNAFIVPISEAEKDSSTLASSIAAIFSANYKAQGLRDSHMKSNEYLLLSPKDIDKLLESNANIQDMIDLSHSKTANNKLLRPLSTSVSRPLTFTYEIGFKSSNLRDIRQKIVESNMPIALTYTQSAERYFFPCTLDAYKNHDSCKKSEYKLINGQSLAPIDFSTDFSDSTDYTFSDAGRQIPTFNKTVLIIGYSNSILSRNFVNITKNDPPRGGFIVRTNNKFHGHSYEFLAGLITEEKEREICPCQSNPMNWISASLQCLESKKDPAKCETVNAVMRGNNLFTTADRLKCINSVYCDTNSTYSLVGYEKPIITFSETGVPLATIAKIDKSSVKSEVFKSLPFQHLNKAFMLEKTVAESGKCGYTLVMYDELESIIKSGIGTWLAYSVNAKFDSGDYAKSMRGYYTKWDPITASQPSDL